MFLTIESCLLSIEINTGLDFIVTVVHQHAVSTLSLVGVTLLLDCTSLILCIFSDASSILKFRS